jgi:hypothetical protein
VTAAGAVLALGLALAPPAGAHPLGNFTVSHYDGIVLSPDRLVVTSVVDSAEIPTQQAHPSIDVDDDGELSAEELAADAVARCAEVRDATEVSVDGSTLRLDVVTARQVVVPGAASLDTLRLECELSAPVDLSRPAVVDFEQTHRTDRIGWREITAVGDGVALVDPPVPATSISDELRAYPDGLLLDPLEVRSARLVTRPGTTGQLRPGSRAGTIAAPDPLSRLVAAGDARLESYIGSAELTRSWACSRCCWRGCSVRSRDAARPRQDGDGGVPGWATWSSTRRGAGRDDRDAHPHRRRPRARARAHPGQQRGR